MQNWCCGTDFVEGCASSYSDQEPAHGASSTDAHGHVASVFEEVVHPDDGHKVIFRVCLRPLGIRFERGIGDGEPCEIVIESAAEDAVSIVATRTRLAYTQI